jgi:hypothetical protein
MATPSNTKLDTPHTATKSARAPRVILTILRRGEERGERETERVIDLVRQIRARKKEVYRA